MSGKLYGVGIGPGDPELVTLKAKRVLDEVSCIAVPKTASDRESVALSIVENLITGNKEILELVFPMSYDENVLESGWETAIGALKSKLDRGCDVALITLGDPTVYSTYIYVHKLLVSQGYDAEIIPGITSFCASAARAGVSLGENRESIAVVPSAYECENLEGILEEFDNVVLMKVSRNLPGLINKLKEKGVCDRAVLVSKCGFEDEKVEYDLDKAAEGKTSYFSTMIVKKRGVR